MQVGDEFRVITYIKKKPRASTGKIISIGNKIIIKKVNGFLDCFSIGDLIDKYKKKQIEEEGQWIDMIFEQRGNSIVPIKIIRGNNNSSDAEQSRTDTADGNKE